MEILTPRLTLRSARADDLAAMHAVLSDPRATRWWSTPPHETLDQTRDWLDSMIAHGPDNPDFVIERDGVVIGKAGFWKLPEVGYILHPDHWGQGIAAEVMAHKYQEAPAEYITVWSTADHQSPAARGLKYEIGMDGRVQTIAAGGPSITYVEGCA